MGGLTPFLIAGLVTGAVYGLAAVGLVLTYKTSGVFNFAHGAMATVGAFGFYSLHVQQGMPWQLAALVCLVVLGPAMGLVLELVARVVGRSRLDLQIAATVGLLLVVQSAVTLIYGQLEVREVPVFLPAGEVTLGGTVVQWSDIATFVIASVVTALLWGFLRTARAGVAMRAVVDDPDLLDLAGTSPVVVRRIAWCVGSALATLSGILFAPLLPLDPLRLTLLVVQAFGAAAIGRFTSLPVTFAGGLAVGVLSSVATKYFTTGFWAGVPAAVPFLALFLVLLFMPKRFLVERSRVPRQGSPAVWRAPLAFQIASGLVVLAFLAVVPSFAGIHLTDWTVALAMVIVFLSLGLLVRTSGQVSLSHVTFAAIGAASFSHLTVDKGVPWLVGLLLCGLVAVPIGAVLAIPAIRLSGLYLALATFGFGIVVQVMFYTEDYLFGDTGMGLPMPRPTFLGADTDEGYYRLVLVLVTSCSVLVLALTRGRLGRLLRGVAESPTALRTSGVSIEVTRVLVFCLSSFLAAVGGALVGGAQTTISADSYPPLLSLTWFAVVVVVVGGAPWYALLAAGLMVLVPSYSSTPDVNIWMQLVFGVAAVAVSVADGRLRVPAALSERWRPKSKASEKLVVSGVERSRVVPASLELDSVTVRFGGVTAVNELSLSAPTGRITGLIGPNGAGKTTTFNAATGLVRPASGEVVLAGARVTRASVAGRARRGLGRTFQKMELFDSMTVLENVALGREGGVAGAKPWAHLIGSRWSRRQSLAVAGDALRLCGIDDLWSKPVGSLSTGQRRLVELARCLASEASILLLDEPSSGLDHRESDQFGQILQDVVERRGVGILLVEHDMTLVLDVCDYIYVLDFGNPLFEGTPAEVRASSAVQAAYLGDQEGLEVAGVER